MRLLDPYLIGAVLAWVAVYAFYRDPLGLRMRHWERGLLTAIEVPIFVTVMAVVLPVVGLRGARFPVIDLTGLSLVGGLVYALRWWPAFNARLTELDFGDYRSLIRVANFFIPVTFGVAMGSFVHMTNPNAAVLDQLYGYQLILAIEILQSLQATLGVLVVTIAPTVTAFVAIFENNVLFAARAALIGAVGGITDGVLLPAIMVMVVHAGLLLGLVSGIMLRNSIAAGAPILGPPLTLLSSFGALVAGHTIWEYIGAIAVAGAGGAGVAHGLVSGSSKHALAGVKVLTLGVALVFLAGIAEVTYDPFITQFARGYVSIEPVVNDLPVDVTYGIAVVSTIASSLGVLKVTTWMTELWGNYV